MQRLALLLLVAAAVAAPAAVAKSGFPETIALPNGWQPEGIAIGHGTTFYAGSIPTGAIYRGDLRTGTGEVFIAGASGRAATGLKFDRGRLFVSGAATGKGFVYDARSGTLLREYQFATAPTFVNDVVVTKDAAYFTDSSRAVLYRVALAGSGAPAATFTTLPLTGAFQLVAGFNLNGIDATANGKTLIAVQSATGKLFRIDAATGATTLVDLGGATLPNGDGLLLHGTTLYVVQNQLNRIAVVKLDSSLSAGTIKRTITSSHFDVPTTIALFGSRLYAVNARFSTPPTATTPYTVVQVRR
jgi:sugar lactone lactonase YvrE